MIFKEEMENKLKNYEMFREGGARIQVEIGRPCTMAEISLNVIQFKRESNLKTFYFNAEISVKEAKAEICKAFDPSLNAEKQILYRVDAFEEPSFALRRVNITFSKNNVNSGEMLILKSDAEMSPSEKFKMSISLTQSGLSEDSQFLQDIEVPREITLAELKDILLDMPTLESFATNVESHEFIRIREK